MFSKKRMMFSYLALGLLAVGVGVASARNSMSGPPSYDLSWHTFEPGGTSTGGSFTLAMVIGQPDAGNMSGGSFDLQGGFLPGTVDPFCLGDVAGVSPGFVDVNDLLAVLAAWGPCPGPCPPHCAEDVQGPDCSVDVNDLLLVLAQWGTCP